MEKPLYTGDGSDLRPFCISDEEYGRVNDLACEYWHFFDNGRFYVEEFELHE